MVCLFCVSRKLRCVGQVRKSVSSALNLVYTLLSGCCEDFMRGVIFGSPSLGQKHLSENTMVSEVDRRILCVRFWLIQK
jgi:hypothetical protein